MPAAMERPGTGHQGDSSSGHPPRGSFCRESAASTDPTAVLVLSFPPPHADRFISFLPDEQTQLTFVKVSSLQQQLADSLF